MSLRDPESLLFDAISTGNMYRVKQLLGSGISKNTILHSPIRWEGTTILATAAYTGNIDIVRFLVQTGTSVNFKDPCLNRNALHWACMGQGLDVVKYLVENGCDINSCDRDNVTPLIQAAVHKNYAAVALLIELGADVNKVDRMRCSTLHYATFHGHVFCVEQLIKAGCVYNNPSIFGKGTPLANLLHHKDFANCKLLINGGYVISNEALHCGDKYVDEAFAESFCYPMSLKDRCRIVIRRSIKGSFIRRKISTLPVPFKMKSYLMLEL